MEAGALSSAGLLPLQRPCRALPARHAVPGGRPRGRRRAQTALSALPADHATLDALTSSLGHLFTLAYEPVVLPCSALNCGDITHRSTLDPVLRMEERGINPQGLLLLAAAAVYLNIKPGVLPGAWDYYVAAKLQRFNAKAYAKEDFQMGKKVAAGGFGTVFTADLVEPDSGDRRKVVMKKATEFGEAEVWMNERMMRYAPDAVARFITAFSDGDKVDDPLWLVWDYEGDSTIAELMNKKDFPANVEPLLFGRSLNIPPGPERRAAVLRILMQQLLENLQACHSAGIVHRDVKPQNMIMAHSTGRVKLIDFGAAADLRIGINYVPNQYLLDMRYAPPQKYIMSQYTPRAPPKPLAALLSPVLWNLFNPDRFDMYSVGITMLQLACPNLKNDNALIAFNKQLANEFNYDLRRWRRSLESKGGKALQEWEEGLAVLDCDNGAGWDLACQLVQFNPSDRLSCSQALAHPWFAPSRITLTVASTLASTAKSMGRLAEVEAEWLSKQMAPSATKERGGFTETQLEEMEWMGNGDRGEEEMPQHQSATIAWWRGRQSYLQGKMNERKARVEADLREFGKKAGKTIREQRRRLGIKELMDANKR